MVRGKNVYRVLIMGLALGFVLMSNFACAQTRNMPLDEGIRTIPIPRSIQEYKAVLVIDSNLKVYPVNEKGELIPACLLCTEEIERKYGSCKEIIGKPVEDGQAVCASLVEATTRGEDVSFGLLRQTRNPKYITIFIGGYQIEVCICGCPGLPSC